MNRISEVTKRDIYDLFKDGLHIDDFFTTDRFIYQHYGRLKEIEFLKRLYNLQIIPSSDSEYPNAEEEIRQHTVVHEDYPSCWIFNDERFQLKQGTDEKYLAFICEIFHPAVRYENGYWKEFLSRITSLLQNDGYEIYPVDKISNRDVYSWRIYESAQSQLFIPYSQRNKKAIKEKTLELSMNKRTRSQIYQLLEDFNLTFRKTDETGWNDTVTTSQEVFDDIRRFYSPTTSKKQEQNKETGSLQNFVMHKSPYCVFDVVECFAKYNRKTDFEAQANSILRLNGLNVNLIHGKIANSADNQIATTTVALLQEAGLKELLQEASNYYDAGNVKIAVEKLWDAFERLKTYYSPTLKKKESADKIIRNMSDNKPHYYQLFEKEFKDLTDIGNDYRIRHHETSKFDIEDIRYYKYFYIRCMSLVSVAIEYLDGGRIY